MYDVSKHSAEAWSRLGEAIQSRRVELGLRQEDLADTAGVSPNTIGNLESGKRGRLLTLPKIARALGWTPESCRLILDGEAPIVEDVEDEPANGDTFRLERPAGMTTEAWELLKQDLVADVERYLRWSRGR